MTEVHRSTIIRMNALLCREFNLEPSTKSIIYHHWFDLNTGKRVANGKGTTKSCPGTAFFGGNTEAAAESNFIPIIKGEKV